MGVSETVSSLSELLNSKPVSARQAAEKAEKLGIDLRYGTIAAYWAGGHGRPTAATLKKLAAVVDFTEEQLQEAAWNDSSTLGPWVPPEESILLDRNTRKALDNLIKTVVASKGSSHADTPPDQKKPGTPPKGRQAKEAALHRAQMDTPIGLRGKRVQKPRKRNAQ